MPNNRSVSGRGVLTLNTSPGEATVSKALARQMVGRPRQRRDGLADTSPPEGFSWATSVAHDGKAAPSRRRISSPPSCDGIMAVRTTCRRTSRGGVCRLFVEVKSNDIRDRALTTADSLPSGTSQCSTNERTTLYYCERHITTTHVGISRLEPHTTNSPSEDRPRDTARQRAPPADPIAGTTSFHRCWSAECLGHAEVPADHAGDEDYERLIDTLDAHSRGRNRRTRGRTRDGEVVSM